MRSICCGSCIVAWALTAAALLQAGDQAETLALVDKAVNALGGAASVAKLKAVTSKVQGTLQEGELNFTYTGDRSTLMPDRDRYDLELMINNAKIGQVLVFRADKSWIKLVDKTEELDKETFTLFRDFIHAMRLAENPLLLKDKEHKLSPVGEIKIGDRPALGVQVTRKDRREANVYFDKESGLPVKSEMRAPPKSGGGQDVMHEFFYSDYKELDGRKWYTKMTWKRDDKTYVYMEMSEARPHEKVDDSIFDRP